MLDWLSEKYHDKETRMCGALIEDAIVKLLISNKKTKDIGGSLSTREFTDLVASTLYA
jgi:isocitrate/isopropylmalate dehydrogenase